MKIKVVSVDDFGGGYCVVTRDDGSTFGQQFKALPIEDATAFAAALQQVADESVARTAAPVARQRHPDVIAMIGQDKDVVEDSLGETVEVVP